MTENVTQAQKDAFEYSITGPEGEEFIWQTLKYLVRLHDLDPDAIKLELPGETGEEYIRFIYEDTFEEEELVSTTTMVDLILHAIVPPNEAERVYQVSPRTLQRWVKRGLPKHVIKGRVYYDEDELQVFMDEIGHVPGFQRLGNGNLRPK